MTSHTNDFYELFDIRIQKEEFENSMYTRKKSVYPEPALFSRKLHDIRRNFLPKVTPKRQKKRIPVVKTDSIFFDETYQVPVVPSISYELHMKLHQQRHSPTRKHRPHPTNLYYLTRLDTNQVVCDVKTEKNIQESDDFGKKL